MRVSILGKFWRLLFTKDGLGSKNWGLCDPPTLRDKAIRVDPDLKGQKRMEIIIHEVTHASGFHLSEEYVEEFARDLARILTKAGYHEIVRGD